MGAVVGQYWELTKPRVVALIVFTAVIGMFLATPELPGWRALVLGSLGIWLAAASAAAINHLLDQRIDAVMARTQHRPLPTGSLTAAQVLGFAVALGALSMLVLALWVNPLTAALTFASLIGYAIIYTGYLKRATPQNIVIGGLAGAAPPLLGWAAVKGWPEGAGFAALFDAPHDYHHALLLVLIIFVWTPPHFWALFYLGGALVLGGVFLYYAVRLFNPPDPMYPMRVFNYSIVYLMVLFAFLLVDHYLVAAPPAAESAGGLSFERVG